MGSARAVSLRGLSGLEHTPEDLLKLQLSRRLQTITELQLVPLGMKEGAESSVLSLSGCILSIAICWKNRNYYMPSGKTEITPNSQRENQNKEGRHQSV